MRASNWYVVQVQAGREHIACNTMRRIIGGLQELDPDAPALMSECFSPSFERRRKRNGEWVFEKRPLLPGYVIVVTDEPYKLRDTLYAVPEFTRLVAMGKTYVPLSQDDKSWIERWTKQGDRVIPMSLAYKRGDTIVVTDGPLVGHEAMITKVNRRKRVAHVEVRAGQMIIHTTVGLEVLPEPAGE